MSNGMLCEGAYCRRARASERKNSRVGRLFVSLLKNARTANILHIMHFENLGRQVLLCCLPSLVRFRRLVFLVWFPGRSSGVLLGITSLMCGTPVLDRGWKLLCKMFNSSQPRFGRNGILRVKPMVFRSI